MSPRNTFHKHGFSFVLLSSSQLAIAFSLILADFNFEGRNRFVSSPSYPLNTTEPTQLKVQSEHAISYLPPVYWWWCRGGDDETLSQKLENVSNPELEKFQSGFLGFLLISWEREREISFSNSSKNHEFIKCFPISTTCDCIIIFVATSKTFQENVKT